MPSSSNAARHSPDTYLDSLDQRQTPHVNEDLSLSSLSSGVNGSGPRSAYPVGRLPVYIDKVANALDLNPRYRGDLHAFKALVMELPSAFWRTAIYQQATIYKSLQNSEELRTHLGVVKEEVQDIGDQLSKRFVVTEDQRNDILALAKSMVFEAGRCNFDFADEHLQRLKDASQYPRFKEVFKSKANIKAIGQLVRRQTSYVRNAYRQFLRDSVYDGRKQCGLTQCVRQASRKFNGGEDASPEAILQVAILRRFVRENRELVTREDDDSCNSDEELIADDFEFNGARKRKRGRPANHFWGAVSQFFKTKNALWGKGLRTDGWAKYIDESLEQEHRAFPNDTLSGIPRRTNPPPPSRDAEHDSTQPPLPAWAADDEPLGNTAGDDPLQLSLPSLTPSMRNHAASASNVGATVPSFQADAPGGSPTESFHPTFSPSASPPYPRSPAFGSTSLAHADRAHMQRYARSVSTAPTTRSVSAVPPRHNATPAAIPIAPVRAPRSQSNFQLPPMSDLTRMDVETHNVSSHARSPSHFEGTLSRPASFHPTHPQAGAPSSLSFVTHTRPMFDGLMR